MDGNDRDIRARLQSVLHTIAETLIRFWFRHAAVLGILSLVAFAVVSLAMSRIRPVYSWDTLAYIASAARDTVPAAADLHAYAYDTLRGVASPESFSLLAEGDAYRLRQYTDPQAFVSMLGMYDVKWLYIRLLGLLTPFTGAYEAGFAVNILAMALLAFSLGLWMRANGMLAYAPLVVCLMFILQFPSFGMMHTPDFLATALLVAAVLALDRNWTWTGCALVLLCVVTRPDQFAFAGVLMVIAWFWKDRSQIAFLITFVLCIAGYALTGASGQSVGWWPHLWFSTYQMQDTLVGFAPDFSLRVYLVAFGYNLYRSMFENTWLGMYGLALGVCIFMYVRGMLAPSRRQVLIFALMICIPAKYTVFPLHDGRIYFGLLLLVFLLTAAEAFRQTPRAATGTTTVAPKRFAGLYSTGHKEMSMERTCLAVVLAAGESTRMKSSMSKVLHPVAGRPMIAHVMGALAKTGISSAALVLGRDADAVEKAARIDGMAVTSVLQKERLGTGHAVLAAAAEIEKGYDHILVVFGDTPLITDGPLTKAREAIEDGNDVSVIGFKTEYPIGYGRMITRDGNLLAIREEKDASDEERLITFCNGGVMAISGSKALDLLRQIGNANAKGEFYLTDLVEIVRSSGGRAVAVEAPETELTGCNNRAELAAIERIWQERRRHELMVSGVSMIAPETVFLSFDTEIGQDVLVEPNVVFGPGVRVETGAVIHAFCHLEGAHVGSGATVGPYARLRPGADLGEGSKVGNFCEVKQADIGAGAKVNHLTYIGDAAIGAHANIGAGTITCNYDGINKHRTEIGEGAFIGSNSSLVAPVSVGNGAYVASGSVITENVPDDAVAFGRARQEIKEGHARVVRERNLALKAARQKSKAGA